MLVLLAWRQPKMPQQSKATGEISRMLNILFGLLYLLQKTYDEARHYSLIFQQPMMLVLVGGRWLGPKGALSRDQLSQLLLALTGMAADML